MKFVFALPLLLQFHSLAALSASNDEIFQIAACHNAIVDKSIGATEKLNFDTKAATPILLLGKSRYYFMTGETIFASEKAYPGERIAFRLKNAAGPVEEGEVSINADGKMGSFGGKTPGAIDIQLVETNEPQIRKLFTDDLIVRIRSMCGREQYNNKAANVIQSTRDALEVCKKLADTSIKDAVGDMTKQIAGGCKSSYKAPTRTSPGKKTGSAR